MRRSWIFLLAVAATAAAARPVGALAEPARWLQGYLRIDTTNPPGGEHRAAGYLAGILRAEGIAVELYGTPAGRTNLVARLAAPGGGEGPLVLLHHMDTVAAGPGWTVEPFGGLLREDRLYGRGAIDAKSLGIAHLAAFLELRRQRVPLRRDVLFVAVADEETGGREGTGFLVERHAPLFAGAIAVLNEGGANRMVNGRILWWGVEVAQKRPLWLDVEAAGRPGHASGLQPHSAAHTLVAGLARLLARPPRWHVTPAARPYLAALAPLHSGKWRRIFSRIDEHIAPEGPKSGLLPGMANLFLDTVQVTRLTAGEQINVIPERASAQIDVRLLPDTDDSTFLAGARESLGSEITLRTLLVAPASAPAPAAGATWETLVRTLSGGKPVVPAFIAGFTDSRWFRERAIPAYGVMPFALEAEALAGIHGPDEHLSLAALADGVERMKRIVRALASE